jgi:choice-of-anchor C domain-containing protein
MFACRRAAGFLCAASLSLLALTASPAAAQIDLLVNGDFEAPIIGGGFQAIPPGPGLTGWTVGGAGIDHIAGFWQPSSGAQSIDLSALSAGSITQTVNTLLGSPYSLVFDLAGNPDGGDAIKDVLVEISDGPSSVETFDITGFSRTNMGWSTRTINFVATSTTTTVTFTSLENNAFGPALDNVHLFGPSPAPEPGALALLGLTGIPLLGAVIRRRRA